jgi:hypothetical protein
MTYSYCLAESEGLPSRYLFIGFLMVGAQDRLSLLLVLLCGHTELKIKDILKQCCHLPLRAP